MRGMFGMPNGTDATVISQNTAGLSEQRMQRDREERTSSLAALIYSEPKKCAIDRATGHLGTGVQHSSESDDTD